VMNHSRINGTSPPAGVCFLSTHINGAHAQA